MKYSHLFSSKGYTEREELVFFPVERFDLEKFGTVPLTLNPIPEEFQNHVTPSTTRIFLTME